jgi:hypothetical protein
MNDLVVSLPSLFPMQSGSREIVFHYLAFQTSIKPRIDEPWMDGLFRMRSGKLSSFALAWLRI